MTTFELPKSLDEARVLDFCCSLNNSMPEDHLVLDISQVRWAFPFGTLVIASQLRRIQNHYQTTFELTGYDETNPAHTYLSHVGFFHLLGFEIGNKIGQAMGSSSYIPITVLDYTDLMIDEIIMDNPMHRAIQAKADEIARLLTQSHKSTVTRPVSYCLRELIRNVFEHAETAECLLSGQSYKDGRVLVGVVDHGRGMLQSLRTRHEVATDIDALKLSLKPGISRNIIDESDDNPWSNSGFGLYVLSELGRKTGYFSITSGSAILKIDKKGNREGTSCHEGTAINIIFQKLHGTNLGEYIESIIAAGEKQTMPDGKKPRASKSSKNV